MLLRGEHAKRRPIRFAVGPISTSYDLAFVALHCEAVFPNNCSALNVLGVEACVLLLCLVHSMCTCATGASLKGADLRRACLKEASFRGAYLVGIVNPPLFFV
jgi:hypothetical protein